MAINARLNLVILDEKSKVLYFDKSRIHIKSEKQLLEYFINKYSEFTGLNDLREEDQKKIVKDFACFIKYSLYYMKEFYPLGDEPFFKELDVLNPKFYSRESWINLKNFFPQVSFFFLPKYIKVKFN
jgi:hypothetical protein